MSKRSSNQGGAILSFIIIAAVLVAVTVGSIYFVQKRGEQTRREQAIARADKLASDQKAKQAAADRARRAADAEKLASNQPTTSTSTDSKPSTDPEAKATELPTTGPVDTLLTMLAIGCLVATSISFVSSRRVLARSL